MIDALPVAAMAFLGACIGSFLNVCIYRLPRGTSIAWPPSACTMCGRRLAWFENVPIVSYIVLRRRCRGCGEPISVRYPVVEAITAVMFASAWWFYGPGLLLVSRLVLGCALVVLFEIDREHRILPHAITLPGIVVGFAFSFLTEPGWKSSLGGIMLGGGILFALYYAYYFLRHREGLGLGDYKMLAMIGAFLGWRLTLVTLMMASLSGSMAGIYLIASRRGGMESALPFGTFLAVGAAVAAAVGTSLLTWYLSLW
jgi:leader peptidase (prepilin peptidase)/N-methyltransferase